MQNVHVDCKCLWLSLKYVAARSCMAILQCYDSFNFQPFSGIKSIYFIYLVVHFNVICTPNNTVLCHSKRKFKKKNILMNCKLNFRKQQLSYEVTGKTVVKQCLNLYCFKIIDKSM